MTDPLVPFSEDKDGNIEDNMINVLLPKISGGNFRHSFEMGTVLCDVVRLHFNSMSECPNTGNKLQQSTR